jgi:hypothetical protein
MYIAHSALRANIKNPRKLTSSLQRQHSEEETDRYAAYQAACSKYREEIKAIQKYLPGWVPSPPTF